MKDKELQMRFSDIKQNLSRLEKSINKKLEESEKPYKPGFSLNGFIYIVTIVLIVAFSLFVGFNAYTNSTAERNMDTTILHAVSERKILEPQREKPADDRIVTIERKTDLSVTAPGTRSEVTYRILVVSYFLVMAFVLFLLVYLLKNDDGGIRFDKMNELHSLRNAFFDFKDMQNLQNEIVEEVDILDGSNIKSDVNRIESEIEKTSTMNINYNVPCKKTTKHKNLMLDFIKSYMNAINEV